jgi:hypothetical protein
MPMTVRQIPKDGYGKEKTIIGNGVRLKAKNLEKARSTTLKITGVDSGAVQYVNILVQTGTPARFSNPISSPPREDRNIRRQDERDRDERDRGERDRGERDRGERDRDERERDESRRETSRTR